jgi:hypothetical protein
VISRLRALWNNVFRREQLDRDLDEELQAYVELVPAEKVQTGVRCYSEGMSNPNLSLAEERIH